MILGVAGYPVDGEIHPLHSAPYNLKSVNLNILYNFLVNTEVAIYPQEMG